MVNFIKTASQVNTLSSNEYPLNIQTIADDFELRIPKKVENSPIKAFWIIGWESDVDGVWFGNLLLTFDEEPVGVLTLNEDGESIQWFDDEYDFKVFDYITDLIEEQNK